MHTLPATRTTLRVSVALASACFLTACERYPWEPPKPVTGPAAEQRHGALSALPAFNTAPADRQGFLSMPIPIQDATLPPSGAPTPTTGQLRVPGELL